MYLQLPESLKTKVRLALAKGVRARYLLPGVFAAGVVSSFFNAACTGQVYLPTLMIIAEVSFWESFGLLAWYNLMFIVPLLGIFALMFFGVGSQQIAGFFKRYIGWTKVAIGFVFVFFSYWLWTELTWPPGFRG